MQEQALFDKRISIALTPENAQFSLSAGGLLSLTLTKQDGTVEEFERVIPVRAFPITDPDLYPVTCLAFVRPHQYVSSNRR